MHSIQVLPGEMRMRWVELPGTEPVRVYVAGLGSTAGPYFTEVALHPALAGRQSLLIDLLEHGLSDRPDDFGYTLAEQADALATMLRGAGVHGAEVGHSMGGSVAILLTAHHSDLVSRLVVVDPNLRPTPRPRLADRTEAPFVAGFPAVLAEAGETWAVTMRLADPVAVYRSERTLGDLPDLRSILAGLPVPKAGRAPPSPTPVSR